MKIFNKSYYTVTKKLGKKCPFLHSVKISLQREEKQFKKKKIKKKGNLSKVLQRTIWDLSKQMHTSLNSLNMGGLNKFFETLAKIAIWAIFGPWNCVSALFFFFLEIFFVEF